MQITGTANGHFAILYGGARAAMHAGKAQVALLCIPCGAAVAEPDYTIRAESLTLAAADAVISDVKIIGISSLVILLYTSIGKEFRQHTTGDILYGAGGYLVVYFAQSGFCSKKAAFYFVPVLELHQYYAIIWHKEFRPVIHLNMLLYLG